MNEERLTAVIRPAVYPGVSFNSPLLPTQCILKSRQNKTRVAM